MPEVHDDTPFVFVSYSHEDRNFVTRLRTDLQAHGIEVWVDKEGIQAGTPDWEQALRDAIQTAHAVLFIASPDARNSRYVKDELRIAEYYQRVVYPLWVAGNQWIEAVPIGLGSIQYIDVRESRYQTALPEIVQTIQRTFKEISASLPPPYHRLILSHAILIKACSPFASRMQAISLGAAALFTNWCKRSSRCWLRSARMRHPRAC